MRTDLDRFFNPRSIAIVGASQDLITISGQPLKHLQSHGFRGKLYPVNPKYQEILGVKCHPSLAALPETPDLVLVLINASRVADTLRECGKRGVPYAIVYSSGYSEVGGKGIDMQRELGAIAEEYNIGIIGPNCQGMINVADRVYAGFGSVFAADYDAGGVSMVSQSGGFGFSVMNLASHEGGLNFRQIVTTGNEIGVSTLDFINYFIDDPQTRIIACYIEGLKDAHRLLATGARALQKKKPILAWKVGNTEQGQQAARSHTANLGGAMALYQAAFRQAGIIQIDDIQDVMDYGRIFRSGKLPAGNRVAIITISGGAGILMTDECVSRGMQVPALTPATVEKLRAFVPSFGSLLNPVDITAGIFNDLTLIKRTLNVILEDPNVDSIAMINASLQGELATRIAAEIAVVTKQTDKPFVMAWSARDAVAREAYAILDEAGIPHYKSPVRCGRALAALSWYAEALRRSEARQAEMPAQISSSEARTLLAGRRDDVSGYAARQVLAHYGIAITREELATSKEQALAIEVILGITNDKMFGPAIMFGLGGIFAEVLKDAAFRLAPVTKSAALEMISEIKGYAVLTGARGAPHADIDALADTIVRLSALAVDLKDCVAELDINPLFVFAQGKGVKAGDALIKPLRRD